MSFHFMRYSREQLVLDEIDAANRLLSAADRERKYRKMSASPYGFFRGTNHLFWGDVWDDWRYYLYGGVTDTQTWLQGDAHVYNHGAYGDARQGIHYGMDDFDDAVIADYQYDLWRHAASMVLDAEENAGLSSGETRRAIRHTLGMYLETVAAHADGRNASDVHVDYARRPLGPFMEKVRAKKGPQQTLDKWTVSEHGQRVFNTDKNKLGAISAREKNRLVDALNGEYQATLLRDDERTGAVQFLVKDVARRLNAGTGSLGLRRYYALIGGENADQSNDFILDIKQQTPPAAYRFMTDREKRAWGQTFGHEGLRHARAFRAMANQPDTYVGWLTLGKQEFSVRERSPYKKDFPTHKIKDFKHYRRLTREWGRIMAREHIRGAQTLRPEEPAVFCQAVLARCDSQLDAFKEMVVELAFSYARRVKDDYAVFVAERGYT